MAEIIYYCPGCKKVFSSDKKESYCKCGAPIYNTALLAKEWRTYSQEKKNSLKATWQADIEAEELEKKEDEDFLLSTSSQLNNYVIKDYYGVVTGSNMYLTGGLGGEGLVVQDEFVATSVEKAMQHLKKRAKGLSHKVNAIIGIHTTVTSPVGLPVAAIIVVVTGTAVSVEQKTE